MISLLVTLTIFPLIGYATTLLLRFSFPATFAGRIATCFLLGAGVNGSLLYLAGAIGAPMYRPAFLIIPVVAVIIAVSRRPGLASSDQQPLKRTLLPNVILAVPLIALFCAAAILPIRDYDGRVTWLPKARAIVFDGDVNGPFFQGQAGLNLHNQYPLLMSLNAATVMQISGDTAGDTVRWLYVLIAIASLVAVRDLLLRLFGLSGAWVIAIAAWLPALFSLEGGALSAYSDLAIGAFAGLAILFLMTARDDPSAARTAGALLAFVVLTKNEGVVFVAVILAAAAFARTLQSPRQWLACAVPPLAALGLLLFWRAGVPPAYDEQYTVLLRELPQSLHRVPAAMRAMARHAIDTAEWGWFWPFTAMSSLAIVDRRVRPLMIMPLVVLTMMLAMYLATFTVTRRNVDELANVAARRLLSQLIIPACCILAAATRAITGNSEA